MSGLLPRKQSAERPDADPQVVGLTDQRSTDVFAVLSSGVARSVLQQLYRGPATQSTLADRVGTSIQNVDYHLDNLREAGLVEIVDQWYSEKGKEMDVYAPSGPLVLVAGSGDQRDVAGRAVADGGTDADTYDGTDADTYDGTDADAPVPSD
jgi:DNA-binding transcriptional ArsR family regulator